MDRGMTTLGERIRRYRQERNLTQYEFARRLGVRPETISLIERNESNGSEVTVSLIAQELGVTVQELRGLPPLPPLEAPDRVLQWVRIVAEGPTADREYALRRIQGWIDAIRRRRDARGYRHSTSSKNNGDFEHTYQP